MSMSLPPVRPIGLVFGSALILLSACLFAIPSHADGPGSPSGATAPMYRGDLQRSGDAECSVAVPMSVAWQNTTAPVDGNTSSPVLDNGVIYFGAGKSVYAISASDGSLKWTFPVGVDAPYEGPFYATPTVADGKVLIGSDDHNLYALDENTGAMLWKFPTGGPVRSAPTVDNGVIYFGSMDMKFYAINENTQALVWKSAFMTTGAITSVATTSADTVYFGDGNDMLFAAAKNNGRMLWSVKFDDGLTDVPAIVGNGSVIVASGRDIFGLAPSVGAQKWDTTLNAEIAAPPALSTDNNTLYVPTSDGRLVAINTSGHILWSADVGGIVKAAPVYADGLVILALRSGTVTAVSVADKGRIEWTYSLHAIPPPRIVPITDNGYVTAAPLVSAGAVYTLGNDGTLTAFKSNAVDNVPPVATLRTPSTTEAVAGAQIPYEIRVIDAGSGVNPSTVDLRIDGAKLPVSYSPHTDTIELNTSSAGMLVGSTPVRIDTIAAGDHTLTLKVADWRGNVLTKTWHFQVNTALNPPGSSPPIAAPIPGSEQNTASADIGSDNSGGNSSAADPNSGANNSTGGGFGANPAPSGAGPGSSGGGGGNNNGGGGGAGGSGGASGAGGGGGGAPVGTPGGGAPIPPPPGATNFPPPPPI
jgi:outer membrane protein assembly factor BamB